MTNKHQKNSGLIDTSINDENDENLELEQQDEDVLLTSINDNTSAIKSILNSKFKAENNHVKNLNRTVEHSHQLNETKDIEALTNAIKEQTVLIKKNKSKEPDLIKECFRDTKVITKKSHIETPNIETPKTTLNPTVHASIKTPSIKPDIDRAIGYGDVKELNSVKTSSITPDLDKIILNKVIGVDDVKTLKPKPKSDNYKRKARDSKGRFIGNTPPPENKDNIENEKTSNRLLNTLKDIKDNIPTTDNLDPTIDATKEVFDGVSGAINTSKNIIENVSVLKKDNADKKDNVGNKENKKFFKWFKKRTKKEDKKDKKVQDTLEDIANKKTGKDGGFLGGLGGLITSLFSGKLFKKIGAIIGGGLGLKTLFKKDGLLRRIFTSKNKGVKDIASSTKKGGLFKNLFKTGGKGLFSGGMKGIIKGGAKRIPLLGSLLAFADGGIGGGLGAITGGIIGSGLGPVGTVVGSVIGEQVGKWLGGFNLSAVGETITKSWESTVSTFSKSWDTMLENVSSLWGKTKDTVKETYETVKETTKETISNSWDSTKEFFSNGWSTVTEKVGLSSGDNNNTKEQKPSIKAFNNPDTTQKYLDSIISKESGGQLDAVNQYGYMGLYQMGASALTDSGMIKRKAFDKAVKKHGYNDIGNGANAELHKAFLDNPKNWTIKGGAKAFLNSRELQDKAMTTLTNKNAKQLEDKHVITKGMNDQQIGQRLASAHISGVGGASDYYLNGKNKKDGNGTTISEYSKFNINPSNVDNRYLKNTTLNNTKINGITPHVQIPKLHQPKNIDVVAKAKAEVDKMVVQRKSIKEKETKEVRNLERKDNTNIGYSLSQLLTQDVSERTIAHIVNGGLSKPSKI